MLASAPASSLNWLGFTDAPLRGVSSFARCKLRLGMSGSSDSDIHAENDFHHITVLKHESVEQLQAGPDKIIVDCTLGGGGHTELLLETGATVYGVDQDPEALAAASLRLKRFGDKFIPLMGNFRDLPELLQTAGIDAVDGILADIGVSSHQIDRAERGFSFQKDGPLDMRMNPTTGETAADIVNTWSENELLRILWDYGEEKSARRIVRAILEQRAKTPFERTSNLVECISGVIRKSGPKNPATKTFQSLRIAVNDELGALEHLLTHSISLLNSGGRLAIISFHSLEDRIVKQFLRKHSQAEIDRPEWPAPRPNPDYHFKLLQRKAISPTSDEVKSNPRARSSKLRAAERLPRS